jgi:PAS domain S-box-containing protein
MIKRLGQWHRGGAIAGAMLLAWILFLLFSPTRGQALPSNDSPSQLAALAYALAALCLLGAAQRNRRWLRLQTLPAGLLSLFALSELVQDLLPTLLDSLPPPAAVGLTPPQALALLLSCLSLAAVPWLRTHRSHLLLQINLQVLFVGLLLSLAGRILNIAIGFDLFIFDGQQYALDGSSAVALFLLYGGVVATVVRSPWLRSYYRHREDRQVFAIGTPLLVVIAIAAWLIGASAFTSQTMTLFKHTLQAALSANTRALANAIQHTGQLIDQTLYQSRVDSLVRQQVGLPQLKQELQQILLAGKSSGIDALWLRDEGGHILLAVGLPAATESNRTSLGNQRWLFWNDGFWLESTLTIARPQQSPLELVVQARLEDIHAALNYSNDLGSSGEVVVCAPDAEFMACFPTRLHPRAERYPRQINGEPLPMSRALAWEHDIGVFRDYRRQQVIAAYAPLPGLGLGMVQKVDTADLHDPLLNQLGLSAVSIGLLVLVAAAFLYRRVRPTINRLAEASLHLQEAQRIGHIGSWEYDTASNHLHWSHNAQRILGLPPQENIDTLDKVLGIVPAEERERVRRAFAAALRGEAPFDIEHPCLRPDGSQIMLHVRAQVFRNAAGEAVRVVGVSRDITDQARSEARIQRREAMLNEAQRIAHLGSWEWQLGSDDMLWSDETFRLCGYDPGSIEPSLSRMRELILAEDWPRLDEALAAASRGQTSAPFDLRLQRPDGTLRHLLARVESSAAPGRRPGRLIGTYLDVTERVIAEQRLAFMARLYALLSKANQAIVRIRDPETLLAAICRIAVEDGGCSMAWGCRVDAGQRGNIVRWGDDQHYVEAAMAVYLTQPQAEGPTALVQRQGGHVICDDMTTDPRFVPWQTLAAERGYRSSAAFAIHYQDEVVALLNLYAPEPGFFLPEMIELLDDLCQDIAFAIDAQQQSVRRQLAEQQLRRLNEELEWRVAERTRALEDANRELESFSYSVSHDLRAPLRSIDGFSQILGKRYHDLLDDAGRDYLDRVRRASQHMGQLIDDLLNLSRVSRGPLRRQEVDLSALAHSVLDELQRSEPERQVSLTIQDDLRVYGDSGLLRVLLTNLLGNAWKFTRRTEQPRIAFGCHEEAGQPVFFVADNGAGFDPAYAQKLFKVFQRLHTQNEFEGTGIGLATVQRIVRRHDGTVWAEGALGLGATLRFTLPQRDEARENAAGNLIAPERRHSEATSHEP